MTTVHSQGSQVYNSHLEASAQTRGFFDSSLLAGVRKLFFILTEIKLD